MGQHGKEWFNLANTEMLLGHLTTAVTLVANVAKKTHHGATEFMRMALRAAEAAALHGLGQRNSAKRLFAKLEREYRRYNREFSLSGMSGYWFCELLIDEHSWAAARRHALQALKLGGASYIPRSRVLDVLTLGRVQLGLVLDRREAKTRYPNRRDELLRSCAHLNDAIDGLRATGQNDDVPRGLLARAAFCRSIGDWNGAARDLDEVEEIAEPGPMRLYLCDMALERARLAFAKFEAFAPLTGLLENDNPPRPTVPGAQQIAELKTETEKQLKIAAEYIEKCDYHRRDEALAELQAVLRGEKRFADLPPRV